jgi:hypothetical protein
MPPPATTSPPSTPNRHQPRPSIASLSAMQRAKRSSSRVTDGVMSRSSDDDNRTAVKVGTLERVRSASVPSITDIPSQPSAFDHRCKPQTRDTT